MEDELLEILNSARENGASESQMQIIVDQFNAKKKSTPGSESGSLESEPIVSESQEPDRLQFLIDNPPIDAFNQDSFIGQEFNAVKEELSQRPVVQLNNDDLLQRLEAIQPKKKKSALELQIQDVEEVRNKIKDSELKAKALSRATDKTQEEILLSDGTYSELKLKEQRIKGNDYAATFGSNLFNASAGIAGTPNAIIESVGRLFISDEEYESIPENMRDDFFTDLLQRIPVGGSAAVGTIAELGEDRQRQLLKESEQLREVATKYNTAISEDLGNLEIKQAGKRIAVEGVGSIPSLIQAVMPYVGIASIATGTAANKQEENKKDGIFKKKDVADAWINGASEGLLEVVTKGLAKKAIKLGFLHVCRS